MQPLWAGVRTCFFLGVAWLIGLDPGNLPRADEISIKARVCRQLNCRDST